MPFDPADRANWDAVRPPLADGAVRRLSQGLLRVRLFGAAPPTLGRFTIVDKRGEGGMGAVFEAHDPVLDRRVAIKVLRDPGVVRPGVNIENEARMLARLSHAHVVAVHELGEADGEKYVCMAFVDGPHLGAWLAQRQGLPWQAVVGMLVAAASGLSAAHRAGIVHRDFKLENVLVGEDGVPRVTDFGLARTEAAPGALVRPGDLGGGRASQVAGTPGYLAPEAQRGAPADAWSDQYSFCVAAQRALAHTLAPVPPAVADALHRGLADDPRARWPDIDALADALRALAVRRGNPDQRARDVLLSRLSEHWIEPVRGEALRAAGFELPVRAELVRGASVGDGDADAIARALHHRRSTLALIGAPGAGKTTSLLAVAASLARLDAAIDGATLPVVLNLSSFPAHGGDFRAWLSHEVVARYALPRSQVERWLDDGAIALLLDGLDEVAPASRARCVAALDAIRFERPLAWVLACREGEFMSLVAAPTVDAVLRLCPPTAADVRAVLRDAGFESAVDGLAEELRNPLLLALFTGMAARGGASEDSGALRERLYQGVLEHGLRAQPPLAPADRDRLAAQAAWLAAASRRAGATEIWLEDLQVGWLPSVGQRAAAQAIGLGLALAGSLIVNHAAARAAGLPATFGWFFGVLAASSAAVIQGHLRVAPMEAMRWSWARVRAWIPGNLALGAAMGGMLGLFNAPAADLMMGVATGLLGLSVMGLVPQGRERRVQPGAGLRESARTGLTVGPVIGLIIGVPVGYAVLPFAAPYAAADTMYYTHPAPGFAWAITVGASATVTSALITGLFAPLLHAGIRAVLAVRSPLPLALPRALDELARRGLLVRVGGGWMFRHPTFRDWLADGRAVPVPEVRPNPAAAT